MVYAATRATLSNRVLKYIDDVEEGCGTAAIQALEKHFAKDTLAEKLRVAGKVTDLLMSDNETLDDYISRVNRMVKRVDDLKITIQELMLTAFFKGLSKDLPIALMSLILILSHNLNAVLMLHQPTTVHI